MVLIAAGALALSVVLFAALRVPPARWLRVLRRLFSLGAAAAAAAGGGSGEDGSRPQNEKTASSVTSTSSAASKQTTSTARRRANADRQISRLTTATIEEEGNTAATSVRGGAVGIQVTMSEDGSGEDQTTPKATATAAASTDIPGFSLAEPGADTTSPAPSITSSSSSLSSSSFSSSSSSSSSALRQPTTTAPTSGTSAAKRPAASLMPPPSVRPSALRPLPAASPNSLAVSARGPPPRQSLSLSSSSSSSSSLTAASTSTLPPAQRPSRKVILPPGHSPLDWAALCRSPPTPTFLRGDDVPPDGRLLKISPRQLRLRNGRRGRDAWGTYRGRVYNLTPYRDFHPGGAGELVRGAGRAGETERLFNETHSWINWDAMLGECLVGVLVGDGEGEGEGEGGAGSVDLEAVD